IFFFFSSRRRHTRFSRDWSSDVCSSDLVMGTGQKLWKRAKQVIPGGNMLLSKRAEMFLPEQWPAYFSKAKGCKVWDLDGNEFTEIGRASCRERGEIAAGAAA